MKKVSRFLAVLLVLNLCFTTAIAAEVPRNNDIVVAATAQDLNSYRVTSQLLEFNSTDDLWIGTLAKWKAHGGAISSTGTLFENGEAIHNDDIIITNGVVGIVLAVGTRNPWGYPAGSVMDAGTVNQTSRGITGNRDMVWSVEFLVNGWMASPGHRAYILSPEHRFIGMGQFNVNGPAYLFLSDQSSVGTNVQQPEHEPIEEQPLPEPGNNADYFERRVFELTNIERVNRGINPFQWNDSLTYISRQHSKDMAANGFMSHAGSDGSSPWDRMDRAGIPFGAAAENVAEGQRTPEEVVNSWMNSEGHRRNILSEHFTEIGNKYSEMLADNKKDKFRLVTFEKFIEICRSCKPSSEFEKWIDYLQERYIVK